MMMWGQYPYMSFKTSDGSEQTIGSSGLVITLSSTTLIAQNSTESIEIPLESLISMRFSDDKTTGINTVIANASSPVSVFSIDGVALGNFESVTEAEQKLPSNVYTC